MIKRSVLFSVLLIIPLVSSFCTERNEDSFYAISSLRYYLQTKIEDNPDQEIAFEEDELADLWEKAGMDSASAPYVEIAKEYCEAGDFQKSEQLLYEIWEEFNKEILGITEQEDSIANALQSEAIYPNFDDNPYLDANMRMRILPYLLPQTHPLKPKLDAIFSQFRVTETDASIRSAGFQILFFQNYSFIRVLKHALLPKYLLKVYPDYEMRIKEGKEGWEWFVMRCEGACNVQRLIQRKNLKYFLVPSKYIYPLPVEPAPKLYAQTRKPVILVVKDMGLVGDQKSYQAWKNAKEVHLKELFCILSHGYSSTFLVNNMPYTIYNKWACIDTEHPKRTFNYAKVKKYFSSDMQKYWDKLVKKGGKI